VADINPSLPIIGQPVSTEDPKIVTALSQLVSTINNLDTANLSATAAILDTQMATPAASATWKTIAESAVNIGAGTTSGTYFLREDTLGITASGATAVTSGIYLDATDYSLTGRTPKLRLRVAGFVGGPPGINFTFGLYTVTPSNSGGTLVLTSAGVVSGSTAVIGVPPGNTKQSATSSTISFPSADTYALGVALSGTTAGSSNLVARVLLQMSHA
jgi:hypothetical protein